MGIKRAKNLLTASELRRKAEVQLQVKTAKLHLPRTNEETQRLVHELEVHKIELELQNAELLQDRDEMEKALDKYADLFDFAPIGYFTLGRDGAISAVNLAGAGLLDIERPHLLGQRFGLFVAAKARPLFADFLGKVFSGLWCKESCDVTLTRDGHSPLFVRIEAIALGAGLECRAAVIDITKRKQAEEALLQSEHQFRTLANAIPQMCWVANADGGIFWYNQRWYEFTGTTPEQMDGWGWQSVHDPEALPQVLERWKASIATGKAFDMVFPLRGSDGVFRPFLTRGMPVCDQDGKVVRWFGTNTDISEQKRV